MHPWAGDVLDSYVLLRVNRVSFSAEPPSVDLSGKIVKITERIPITRPESNPMKPGPGFRSVPIDNCSDSIHIHRDTADNSNPLIRWGSPLIMEISPKQEKTNFLPFQ